MKILLPFAIGLIPVSIIGMNSIWDFPFERYLISYLTNGWYRNPFVLTVLLLNEIVTIFFIVTAVCFLITPSHSWRERSFHILRCTYCINFLFGLPYFFTSLNNFSPDWNSATGYFALLKFAINLFISLVLFRAGKFLPVPRIDLSEFMIVESASKGARLVHHIIDLFFLTALSDSWYVFLNANLSISWDTALLLLSIVTNYFLYFFLSESLFRQTPGQAIMNSCVVGINRKMSPKKALLRSLGRLIPFDRYSFLWGGNWHDKVSNTTVVRKNSWKDLLFDAERQ